MLSPALWPMQPPPLLSYGFTELGAMLLFLLWIKPVQELKLLFVLLSLFLCFVYIFFFFVVTVGPTYKGKTS